MVRQWAQQKPRNSRILSEQSFDNQHVYLYQPIGLFGVEADEFVQMLSGINAEAITLHINSPGGDVFDATAIYTALRDHPAQIETRIDGIAASAASFVAQAGDRVVMAKHATMMIHDPWGFTIGNAADHQKQSEVLDKIGDNLASIYAERAGGSVREWRDTMLAETWYSDQEAVSAGLADEVAGDSAKQNTFDLSAYRHAPAEWQPAAAATNPTDVTVRDAERALRDAGLSRPAAKAVLANGWQESARDASGELDRLLVTIEQMAIN